VHHAGYAAAIFRANWNHKAIVAQGDVVFAGFGVAGAQDLLERFLDGVAGANNACADAAEGGGGVIADFAVGKNAAADCG